MKCDKIRGPRILGKKTTLKGSAGKRRIFRGDAGSSQRRRMKTRGWTD